MLSQCIFNGRLLYSLPLPPGFCTPLNCLCPQKSKQVEQKPGGRGRGREWATLGVHPLSWLPSNNRLEKVPFVSVPHTSSNRLLLSNQDKGCTPCVAHSLGLPLGPALLNLWSIEWRWGGNKWKSHRFLMRVSYVSTCVYASIGCLVSPGCMSSHKHCFCIENHKW